MSKKKLSIILTFVFVILLGLCIFTRVLANNALPEYKTVKVQIVSGKETFGAHIDNDVKVIVKYNGKDRELKNVHDMWVYNVGQEIDVYLCEGELYVDLEGAKLTTIYSKVYFAFLGLSFVGLIAMLTAWQYVKKEKKEKLNEVAQQQE